MALPKQHRLRGPRVFDHLYGQGRRFHGTAMVLRVIAAEPSLLPPRERPHAGSPWRCGVVISSKVSKLAVRRNRLRRRLHAHLLADPPCPTRPVWLLISLKPGCLDTPTPRLLGECSQLMRKAGLIHDGRQPGAEPAPPVP